MEDRRQFLKGVVAGAVCVILVALLGVGGFTAARMLRASTASDSGALDLTSSEVTDKLERIQSLIEAYYLDDIDADYVESYLYKGVMAGLGDAYAAYYTEDEYQSLMDSTSGSYYGIGVSVSQNLTTGVITVITVFEGSPAEEAGLMAGDIIYRVGDVDVTGEDLNSVVAMIKGEEYTTVTLTVARSGEDDYIEIEVERRTVEVPTVEYEMLDGNVGYIAISSFDDVTYEQFITALDDLESQGETALIVDLRDNGGGLVSSVCDILDRLLPEGLIVYTEDKYGVREEIYSDAENYFDKPLAVLVNGNSASASEIFAGAIQDYGIGTIVGTTTYGKGIVQKIYSLGDGTAVKLTVSKYYTPNGNNIHGIGIEPDVTVEAEDTDSSALKDDNQVQAALEALEELIE